MRVKLTIIALVLGALAMALPVAAGARTIKVSEGDSIQAAIDAADPGDTIKIKPGTYAENVWVNKDDITIRGTGADRTELVPPSTPNPVCGAESGSVNGICAADVDAEFNVISPVENLKVKDLSVHGFSGAGVFLFGNDGAVIVGVRAEDNEEYGIAAFSSTNGVYSWNLTARNGEAGVYVGDSPEANAEIEHNVSFENRGFGIFMRDASNGEAEHNDVWGNCMGILVLNTGANPHSWEIKDNRVNENNLACPPGDEGDPISGIGIGISSATDIDIEDNVVLGNKPGGPTDFSGGILLVSESTPLADIKVAHNVAFHNDPFDILWDESGTDVRFFGNRCETSSPDGLCEAGHWNHGGHGHHGHHGHGKKHHHGKRHRKHHH
jgi:nitrous oxidase accessory protein NosD